MLTKTATGASWQDASLGLLPQVLVTTRAGASVTATLGSVTVGPVTADENGLATLDLTGYGEWTLTATLGGKTDSDALEVTNVMQYSVELAFSPLPAGYTQLEYIESSGTQYIDTGLSIPDGFRYVGKIVPTNLINQYFFGIGTSGTATGNNSVSTAYDATHISLFSSALYTSSTVTMTANSAYEIDVQNFPVLS